LYENTLKIYKFQNSECVQVLVKFHPRINVTTLFLTKSYFLNTVKPFSGHGDTVG
jgi:hypothetical protein